MTQYRPRFASREGAQLVPRTVGRLRAIARAAVELARARLEHRKLEARDIGLLNEQAVKLGRASGAAAPADAQLVQQIKYIIPGVAGRLPWRADCLVQAMAAQRWLQKEGVAATITVGVHHSDHTKFEAHAWLNYGDIVVTGGETSKYTVMLQHDGSH